MSKNYLELHQFFPDLFEHLESPFNAITDETLEANDGNLQIKVGIEEEEQPV
jgi:hypothetical protein